MDSLRYDSYVKAKTPNMDSVGKLYKVYARGGMTTASLFAFFMNISWYESDGMHPVEWLGKWCWIPRELQKQGYHTMFISSNPLMKLYSDKFNGWNEYVDLSGCKYYADEIVDMIIEKQSDVTKPLYVFTLLMETHQPYPYSKTIDPAILKDDYRPVTRQVLAAQNIDKDFGRLIPHLTDTETLIFSDHGDLDLKTDGYQGHGPAKFHSKLFEVPVIKGII